jgi:hypothetical protein
LTGSHPVARRADAPEAAGRRWRLALILALALSVLYGVPDLRVAFGGPYVAQNDARQHVFWMERFRDPGLFPNDPMADYFQALAPPGFALLYRGAAALGVDPLVFSKVLPLALALVSAAYAFGLAGRILPSPAAAFASALLLSQASWLTDDLPSGSPHAFAVPLLTAFLYHLARRQRAACVVCLALQGLFYPHVLLVSCLTLVLWLFRIERGRLRLTRDRADLAFCAAGLAVALAVLLPYRSRAAAFGPTVTGDEARRLPEFLEGGRARFFDTQPARFWVYDLRSGLLAKLEWGGGGNHVYASLPMEAGFLLPALLAFPRWFPLAKRVSPAAGLLARLSLASLALFAAAHALLFRLHLPSRYSMYSARVILSVAGGIVIVVAADAAWRAISRSGGRPALRRVLAGLAALAVAVYAGAFFLQEPGGYYFVGRYPAVYRFFAAQPASIRIATLSLEADNLPVYSRRSVLVGRLNALPYQLGYYRPVRERAVDLLRAEYAEDPAELAAFVRRYRPDFFLVETDAFQAGWVRRAWVRQFHPLSDAIAARLERGGVPALARLLEPCARLEEGNLVVLDAACVAAGGTRK